MNHGAFVSEIKNALGNHLLEALKKPDVVEVMINPNGDIWIDTLSDGMKKIGKEKPVKVKNIIITVGASLNMLADAVKIVEGELPLNGERFAGILPPIVSNPTISIRKKALKIFSLEDYCHQNTLSEEHYSAIKKGIEERKNFVVVGGTSSGKTTFCNALLRKISDIHPHHRIALLEDTREIQLTSKNSVSMKTCVEKDLADIVKACLRFNPDRIIVGEVRGKEALDMIKAWNTGIPGGVTTIHANSATGGIARIEQLISEISAINEHLQNMIAEAVDILIYIEKDRGVRTVKEVVKITGFKGGNYQIENI